MTVEKLAEEYALKQVPNPNPNDAPYTTTGDIYESIKDAFIEGYKAASSNTGDGLESIKFGMFLTGHGESDINQMYNDWKVSTNLK